VKIHDKILFIGDSITDCGRFGDPEQLGFGYVRLIRDLCAVNHGSLELEFVNAGIGGHRVVDLRERWESDVIAQSPDIVSISIGINDVWRQIDQPEHGILIEEYEQTYRTLLSDLREHTRADIVIMETSVIEEDMESLGNQLLVPYNECIRQLADEYRATLVPINVACAEYSRLHGPKLTTDGVHLTSTGNALFATTWLRSMHF